MKEFRVSGCRITTKVYAIHPVIRNEDSVLWVFPWRNYEAATIVTDKTRTLVNRVTICKWILRLPIQQAKIQVFNIKSDDFPRNLRTIRGRCDAQVPKETCIVLMTYSRTLRSRNVTYRLSRVQDIMNLLRNAIFKVFEMKLIRSKFFLSVYPQLWLRTLGFRIFKFLSNSGNFLRKFVSGMRFRWDQSINMCRCCWNRHCRTSLVPRFLESQFKEYGYKSVGFSAKTQFTRITGKNWLKLVKTKMVL